MKKLGLLFFMAGLILIGFTNCSRRSANDITPITSIPGGDTQKTSTKIDSTGEDIHVTVYKEVVGASSPTADGAEVYLLNTYNAYKHYSLGLQDAKKPSDTATALSDAMDSTTTATDGTCVFKKVKPHSNPQNQYQSGPNKGQIVQYYVIAVWKNPQTGVVERGGWTKSAGGGNLAADDIAISINNGLNNAGQTAPIAVTP